MRKVAAKRAKSWGHAGPSAYHFIGGNAAFFAWLAYIMATIRGSPKDPTFWLAVGILTFLALNFLYVLLVPYIFQRNPSRLFRLIDLWFDAKESELRKRADRSRQDTRPHGRPGDRDE